MRHEVCCEVSLVGLCDQKNFAANFAKNFAAKFAANFALPTGRPADHESRGVYQWSTSAQHRNGYVHPPAVSVCAALQSKFHFWLYFWTHILTLSIKEQRQA
jgi:hypothetical protein